MAIETITDVIKAAVEMEERARKLFLAFGEQFRDSRGASAFFNSLAADESDHARMWTDIGNSLPRSRLAEPPSGPLRASLEAAHSVLDRNPPELMTTFQQAYELTRTLENAELLAVFRLLAVELVPDAKRREFLAHQIDRHLKRVEDPFGGGR